MQMIPTHTVRGNSVILYQDFHSFSLISMLMGASSREKKETDLSQLALASVKRKEQAAHNDSRLGALGLRAGQLGLPVLTHSCVVPLPVIQRMCH